MPHAHGHARGHAQAHAKYTGSMPVPMDMPAPILPRFEYRTQEATQPVVIAMLRQHKDYSGFCNLKMLGTKKLNSTLMNLTARSISRAPLWLKGGGNATATAGHHGLCFARLGLCAVHKSSTPVPRRAPPWPLPARWLRAR